MEFLKNIQADRVFYRYERSFISVAGISSQSSMDDKNAHVCWLAKGTSSSLSIRGCIFYANEDTNELWSTMWLRYRLMNYDAVPPLNIHAANDDEIYTVRNDRLHYECVRIANRARR